MRLAPAPHLIDAGAKTTPTNNKICERLYELVALFVRVHVCMCLCACVRLAGAPIQSGQPDAADKTRGRAVIGRGHWLSVAALRVALRQQFLCASRLELMAARGTQSKSRRSPRHLSMLSVAAPPLDLHPGAGNYTTESRVGSQNIRLLHGARLAALAVLLPEQRLRRLQLECQIGRRLIVVVVVAEVVAGLVVG